MNAVFCWNLRKLAKSFTNPSPPSFTIFMAAILSHLTALHILIIAVNPAVSGRLEKIWRKKCDKTEGWSGNSRANLGIIWAVVADLWFTIGSPLPPQERKHFDWEIQLVLGSAGLLLPFGSPLVLIGFSKTYIKGRICGLKEAISDSEFKRWRSYLIEW